MSSERAIELQARSWSMQAQGRFADAATDAREALRLMQQSEGRESPDVANLLTDLAEIQHQRGELGAAFECGEQARLIQMALGDRFSGELAAQMRARTLAVLGAICRTRGDYPHAERHLAAALVISALALGECSEAAAVARNELGMLYKYWGRFDEAQLLYEQALATMLAVHGEESLACAGLLHNLGGLLHARGAFMQAEAPARRGWEISKRLLGENHPRTLLDAVAYAAVLEGLKRYGECERIYRAAWPILEESFGAQHAEMAALLHNLAAVVEIRGDPREAVVLYRRALLMREALLGPEHLEVALTCNNLGHLLAGQGQRCEAVTLLQRAVATLERHCGAEHPHLTSARSNLQQARTARTARCQD